MMWDGVYSIRSTTETLTSEYITTISITSITAIYWGAWVIFQPRDSISTITTYMIMRIGTARDAFFTMMVFTRSVLLLVGPSQRLRTFGYTTIYLMVTSVAARQDISSWKEGA